jgi:phosphoglycerate dehydrogenase-like enzyme
MRVLYADVARRPELEAELGAQCVDFATLLRESDFVTLHAPLTPATQHLIDAAALAQMKPTAVLVNTARGPLVDPQALYAALRDGVICAAALDVTEPEPIAPDDALLGLPNCVIVPHIASASVATRDRMAAIAARNLLAGLRGEVLATHLNPEAWLITTETQRRRAGSLAARGGARRAARLAKSFSVSLRLCGEAAPHR